MNESYITKYAEVNLP